MAPPIYYLTGVTKGQLAPGGKLARAILESRGLGRTFCDVDTIEQDVTLFEVAGHGPGGKAGCVFCGLPASGEAPKRVGYYPAEQTWTQVEDDLWYGVDPDDPPTPKDLERKRMVPGYWIELAGAEWQIPVIRRPDGGTALPRDWIVEKDGAVTEQIRDAYRALWEEFVSVVDLFFNADDPSPAGTFQLPAADAVRYSLDALALNYRVDRIEQNMLHLVDADNWAAILGATVDLTTFFEVFQQAQGKKKQRDQPAEETAGSANTSPGSADVCPTTDPAGAS